MKDDQISVELIKPIDNQAIYQIIQRTLESYGLDQPGTAYTDPYLNQLYEFYQKEPRGQYWVLKMEEIVIGGIGIAPFGEDEEVAEVQKYYIQKDYQGFGYGRLLFKRAIHYAKTVEYKKLYIETIDTLDKANQIYIHYGFRLLDQALDGSEHGMMNKHFILDLE